jgi:hypothetical protein
LKGMAEGKELAEATKKEMIMFHDELAREVAV